MIAFLNNISLIVSRLPVYIKCCPKANDIGNAFVWPLRFLSGSLFHIADVFSGKHQ